MNNSELFKNLFGGFQATKRGADLQTYAGGRLSVDPITGQPIAKGKGRKAKDFLANPLGIGYGNAINPFAPQVPDLRKLLGGVTDGSSQNPIAAILSRYLQGGGGQ